MDITQATDTVLVVLMPDAGDSMQILKAGLMEISDILVVNKADLPNSENISASIRRMLENSARKTRWQPPVLLTSASLNKGIEALYEAIWRHDHFLQKDHRREARRKLQLETELRQEIQAGIADALGKDVFLEQNMRRLVEDSWQQKTAPRLVARRIIKDWLVKKGQPGTP